MVVLHHSIIQIGVYEKKLGFIQFGESGVDIFFVISGFIICYVTKLNPNITVKQFLIRRVIRVAPIYWLITILVATLAILAPQLFKTTIVGAKELVFSLFFIPHYSAAFPDKIYPIVVPGWTLNYEMFFYLTFALALCFKNRVKFLLVSLSLLALVGILLESKNPLFLTYTNSLLFEFLFGVLLANYFLNNGITKINPSILIGCITLGFLGLILGSFVETTYNIRVMTYGIPALLIVFGFVMLEKHRRLGEQPILTLLGNASYSIYLTHILSLGLFRELWGAVVQVNAGGIEMTLFIISSLVFSSIVGVLFYWMFEKPLLGWFKSQLR